VQRFLRYPAVRGLPRVPFRETVRIANHVDEVWAKAGNLSRGGIFLKSDRTLAPQTEVQLQFSLPESATRFEPTAELIWQEKCNGEPTVMGMRFLGMGAPWLIALALLISVGAPPFSLAPPATAQSESAVRSMWMQRYQVTQRRVRDAEARLAVAEEAYQQMRHRQRFRGEAKADVVAELAAAREELAVAQAEFDEIPELARQAGVEPGWLRALEREAEVQATDPASPAQPE
jgi:hypothetical protein